MAGRKAKATTAVGGPRFGFLGEGVFLNHASVSPPCRAARRAVHEAVEAIAREDDDVVRSRDTVDRARDAFAALVGSKRDRVQSYQNTSAALSAVAWGLRWKPGDEVLVSPNEFVSNHLAWTLQEGKGVKVRPLPTRAELVEPDTLRKHLKMAPRTRVVAVSAVHWATGASQDLPALAEACAAQGAFLVVDAAPSLGARRHSRKKDGYDVLATNTYKWLLSVNGAAYADFSPRLTEELDLASVGWLAVAGEPEPEVLDGRATYKLGPGVEKLIGGSQSALSNLAAIATFRDLMDVGLAAIEKKVQAIARRVMDSADADGIAVVTPRDAHAGLVALDLGGGPEHARKVSALLRKRGVRIGPRGGWLRVSPHFYTRPSEVEALFDALREVAKRA